jgi:hypothetical protein
MELLPHAYAPKTETQFAHILGKLKLAYNPLAGIHFFYHIYFHQLWPLIWSFTFFVGF